MKISFNDDSYVSYERLPDGQGILKIGARSKENRLAMVVNTVELTAEQHRQLFKDPE